MTEAEWLAGTDPGPMLAFLGDKASERKLRLLAVACCRRVWPQLTGPFWREAVERSERFADRQAGPEGLATPRGWPTRGKPLRLCKQFRLNALWGRVEGFAGLVQNWPFLGNSCTFRVN